MEIQKVETEEQLVQLAETAYQVWHEYFPCIISEGQIDYMIEKFQSYEAIKGQLSEGYEYYLFLRDGKIAGYTGIHPEEEDEAGQRKLFLSKLYLKKEYRGQRLASEMLAFLEGYCQGRGLSAIWLTVNRGNDQAIQVYKKKGFVTVREQAADIGSGYVMDDYVMEKRIGS